MIATAVVECFLPALPVILEVNDAGTAVQFVLKRTRRDLFPLAESRDRSHGQPVRELLGKEHVLGAGMGPAGFSAEAGDRDTAAHEAATQKTAIRYSRSITRVKACRTRCFHCDACDDCFSPGSPGCHPVRVSELRVAAFPRSRQRIPRRRDLARTTQSIARS